MQISFIINSEIAGWLLLASSYTNVLHEWNAVKAINKCLVVSIAFPFVTLVKPWLHIIMRWQVCQIERLIGKLFGFSIGGPTDEQLHPFTKSLDLAADSVDLILI